VTPPLVLLHAFQMDSRMFDAVRPAISAQTRLLTPDLRGFGAGPALGDPPPPPDLALLAADVIDEWCLTIAPLLAGGSAGRAAVSGHEQPTGFSVAHLLTEDGFLFLRALRDR